MELAPRWQNNSRDILKSYEEAFKKNPSDFHKQRLEQVGYDVDHTDKDYLERDNK